MERQRCHASPLGISRLFEVAFCVLKRDAQGLNLTRFTEIEKGKGARLPRKDARPTQYGETYPSVRSTWRSAR